MKALPDEMVNSFLMKFMLNHERIALGVIKDKFFLDKKQVREVIIRLFYLNRIFGAIKMEPNGKSFLVFQNPQDSSTIHFDLQEIIDWDLKEFDLEQLKTISIQQTWGNSGSYFGSKIFKKNLAKKIQTNEKHDDIPQKDLIHFEIRPEILIDILYLSIIVKNDSDAPIKEVKFRLNLLDDLQLIHSTSPLDEEISLTPLIINMDDINSHSEIIYELQFSYQKDPKDFAITGFIQFRSEKGFARFVKAKKVYWDLTIPKFIQTKKSQEEIDSFLVQKGLESRIQGVGIPGLDFSEQANVFLNKMVERLNLTECFHEYQKNLMKTYYCGKIDDFEDIGQEFVLIAQVKNMVLSYQIYALSSRYLSAFLYFLFQHLQAYFHESGILAQDQSLVHLSCQKCHKMLKIFPPKGEIIACKYCRLLQKVW
ncbi:MAG: hypothetical protein ACTSVU_00755 [Promethearchaeota archaeon]